jgi:hypothetical protein
MGEKGEVLEPEVVEGGEFPAVVKGVRLTKSAARALKAAEKGKRRLKNPHNRPGIASPYVKTREWCMDMTPLRDVLTEEGLARLSPKKWDLGICQLSYHERAKVGLIREYNPDTVSIPGRPKGYVPINVAYTVVASLPLADVKRVSEGEKPKSARWPKDREVTMQYVRAAREHLSAGARGTPSELNNRSDGMLVQEVRTQSISFVVEVPSVMSSDEWQAQAAREFHGSDKL